jgi:hypothetical protein
MTISALPPNQSAPKGSGSSYTEGTTLQRFATKHRLKTRIDVDETKIVSGAHGQLFEHGPGELAVIFLSPTAKTPGMWNNRRRAGLRVGMILLQNGDMEGSFLFDAKKPDQAKAAITIAAVRRRRVSTPAQKEVLAEGRKLLSGKPLLDHSRGIA